MDHFRGRAVAWLAMAFVCAMSAGAWGQQGGQPPPPDDEMAVKNPIADRLNKVLTDPEEMARADKERNRQPIEFFKAIIEPNDPIPYLKANHWSTMLIELRSNQSEFRGSLQSQPVRLLNMPHEMVYRRDAALVKGQKSTLTMELMVPYVGKELSLQLLREGGLSGDLFGAPLRVLETHQMNIVVLTKTDSGAYGRWGLGAEHPSMFPLSGTKGELPLYDRQRYYRVALPVDAERPRLPGHPLAWSTISHVIWDGQPPETLSVAQQDAMVDWIHWGGQLIIVGGASPNFAMLQSSFLGPFLPAEPSGANATLNAADLQNLARQFPTPAARHEPDEPIEGLQSVDAIFEQYGRRYRPYKGNEFSKDASIFVAGLTPKPRARVIGLGNAALPPLGVEWRVGRGRVLMLGIGLTDKSFVKWAGSDNLIRRVVLRRPEENRAEDLRGLNGGFYPPRYDFLAGPDLSWYRLFARDLGAPATRIEVAEQAGGLGRRSSLGSDVVDLYHPFNVPTAEWRDDATLPVLSRDEFERASGIEIPKRRFVSTIMLVYLGTLIVTWLVARFLVKKPEWAWVVVVLIAVGLFPVVIVRAFAFDIGYDSACTEVDVLETHGNYGRGHLSRFASLYTSGRVTFAISFPDDATALALPMNTGRAIRGESIQQSTFRGTGTPTLSDFQAQPRSLSMFRAEQFINVPGSATLIEEGGMRKLINGSGFDLKDAVVVDLRRNAGRAIRLGAVAAGATVDIKGESVAVEDYESPPVEGRRKNQVDPAQFVTQVVRASRGIRPEDVGEVRLVAWAEGSRPGEVIEPAVDQHQGFTIHVAHLAHGATPDPASSDYDILSLGDEKMGPLRDVTPPNSGQVGRLRFNTAQPPVPPADLRPPTGAMPVPVRRGSTSSSAPPAKKAGP